MSEVTFDQIVIVVLLLLAGVNAGNTVLSFVKNIKEAKKPHDDHVTKVNEHEEKLDRDWQALQLMRDELGILLNGQMLLLQHEITGDHIEKLQEHQDFIQRYLIDHHGGEAHG